MKICFYLICWVPLAFWHILKSSIDLEKTTFIKGASPKIVDHDADDDYDDNDDDDDLFCREV